ENALARLQRILVHLAPRATFAASRVGHAYGRVFHLATLLNLALPAIGKRSLCHRVPPPAGADADQYRLYLGTRARGIGRAAGRPLLWPSAAKYVRKCVFGDVVHAVVSMPTGSGKSFLAELAVSQALHAGWVLYLAPTNALAEQIRGDLRQGLESLATDAL